jgi:hypothetical protein
MTENPTFSKNGRFMERKHKNWLAAHVGCSFKFKVNTEESEGMLDFNRSTGCYWFPFYGGEVNAEICLIGERITEPIGVERNITPSEFQKEIENMVTSGRISRTPNPFKP